MEFDSSVVRILLVDDRQEDLRVLRAVLESPLYELTLAPSGAEALRHVLRVDFAVILLDVMLPEMDGFEVASIIKQRERSRHTPIIFLTASGPELAAIYQAYSVGAVDYIEKPFDPAVVRAKVKVFADLHRKDQRIKQQAEALVAAERRERDLQLAAYRVASRERYRRLAEAIPAIVWTAEPLGVVTYCNRLWHEFSGLEVDEVLAEGWAEVMHPDDRKGWESAWSAAIARGQALEVECRLRRHDGQYRWHLWRVVPEHDEHGTRIGWLGTSVDCDDLKTAISSRDDFLSAASHELRTPLTSLNLQLQSVLLKVDADERMAPLRPKLESAERQARRLTKLIDNLLDLSRIAHRRLDLELEELDLGVLVEEVVVREREDLAKAGCELHVSSESEVLGTWDRLRLDQVVTNLLTNAAKYGSGRPVDVRVEASRERANIVVRDRGIGIASADQQRIFDPFERSVTHKDYRGAGLGLWITRTIVEAMGGTIGVESSPGEGSTFKVDLPRHAGC